MKILSTILFLSAFVCNSSETQVPQQKPGRAFTVIELFTSEGCSSCPPADQMMAEISRAYSDSNVLVLAYHVDYWNRLGWEDPFSSPRNTERQNYYANIFALNSIYT